MHYWVPQDNCIRPLLLRPGTGSTYYTETNPENQTNESLRQNLRKRTKQNRDKHKAFKVVTIKVITSLEIRMDELMRISERERIKRTNQS